VLGRLLLVLSASPTEAWRDARIRTEALVSGVCRPWPHTGHRRLTAIRPGSPPASPWSNA